jgi:rhodanese-related sulfurtransferase
MSSKKRSSAAARGSSGRPRSTSGARGPATSGSAQAGFAAPTSTAGRLALLVVVLVLIAVVVIAADFVFGAISGGTGSAAPNSSPTATAAPATSNQIGVVVQGTGGHWTNVTADQLAGMLTHKDFTLVNVKTPYIGEIDGTDLYIPYDQLAAKASALPGDKGARILVYCRSGAESAIAAQTLLDLGYTNVWNLDGGMNAWQASGRTLVQKNR